MSGQNDIRTWNCERFSRFARTRFPAAAEHHLAAVTGIPAATCRKHLNGETRPGADHMLAYLAAFGPDFARAMLPTAGPWRRDHAERRLEAARVALGDALAQLAGAA